MCFGKQTPSALVTKALNNATKFKQDVINELALNFFGMMIPCVPSVQRDDVFTSLTRLTLDSMKQRKRVNVIEPMTESIYQNMVKFVDLPKVVEQLPQNQDSSLIPVVKMVIKGCASTGNEKEVCNNY